MHMSDALLSPAVGAAMCVASAAAIAYSVKKIQKDDLSGKKIPVMGVMGAFVFAAQMINFTIPATGSSGHICGGILLAAVTGGFPALLSIAAVLLIQCLFFADGGLLALGCNIFNMGVVPCLIAYPLIFRPLVKKSMTAGRITLASVLASVLALQLGAFCVVLQTWFSGISELPFSTFALFMQPIHLAIGAIEGLITAAVLCFIHKARPEMIEGAASESAHAGMKLRNVIAAIAVLTVLTGGALSLFASSNPDGLEWAVGNVAGTEELEGKGALIEGAASVQEATAFMPDYDFKDATEGSVVGTSASGILGGAITFALVGGAAFAISSIKRKQTDGRSIVEG